MHVDLSFDKECLLLQRIHVHTMLVHCMMKYGLDMRLNVCMLVHKCSMHVQAGMFASTKVGICTCDFCMI